jgi:uncharacterized protein
VSDCSLGASRVAALILSAVVFASPARAINCTKARTPVEVAICSDAALGKEDARLASLYFDILRKAPKPGPDQVNLHDRLQDDQRTWLAERDKVCGGRVVDQIRACVSDAIGQRVAALNEVLLNKKDGTLTIGTDTLVVGADAKEHKVLEYRGKVFAESYFPGIDPPFTVLQRWSSPGGAGILLEAGVAANLQCSTIYLLATGKAGLESRNLGGSCVGFDMISTKTTEHGLAFMTPAVPTQDGEETDWDGRNGEVSVHPIPFRPESGTRMRDLVAARAALQSEPLKNQEFFDALGKLPAADRTRLSAALWQVASDCSTCLDDADRAHYGVIIEPDGAVYSGCGWSMHGARLGCGADDALAVWEKQTGSLFFALSPHRKPNDPFPPAWTASFPSVEQWSDYAKRKLEPWRSGAEWVKRNE